MRAIGTVSEGDKPYLMLFGQTSVSSSNTNAAVVVEGNQLLLGWLLYCNSQAFDIDVAVQLTDGAVALALDRIVRRRF